jgi:choline dehydrogenase-like flavoprotein
MDSNSGIENRAWDVIVIGTGVGGATLGYALAEAGKSVLFCEQGRSHLHADVALLGSYPESVFPKPSVPKVRHRDLLERAGRYGDEVEDRSGPRSRRFIPFIGAGTGGSSALYGMALERFLPEDFRPREKFRGMLDEAAGTTLPEAWPITYDELTPYYAQAERLYGVRGTRDPLRSAEGLEELQSAPPLTAASQEVFDHLRGKGLHPYRLPSACAFQPGCPGCQGFLCARDCKRDSASVCLAPALRNHDAALLDQCRVLRLKAMRDRITGVACRRHGQEFVLKGETIILAAGALQTPLLLLRSSSEAWPRGIANSHDLVGRNLMRHCVDLYALMPKAAPGQGENNKEIAFNDFFTEGSPRLGSVQSFGRLPPPAMIVEALEQELRDGPLGWLAGGFRLAKPFVKRVLDRKLSRALILAGLLEDLPYHENRVLPDDTANESANLILRYQMHAFEKARIAEFRRKVTEVLKPYRVNVLKQAENNERIAHVCGTCRFGEDPSDSVLDRTNRAHGLENLYVVDSSFFPSSSGTNPSLTIAANALRVAEMLR